MEFALSRLCPTIPLRMAIFVQLVILPKNREVHFMLSLNDTADVVAQNLSQNFVLHGRVGLASDRVPKLSLNHAERAFDIRAKMVSLQERLSMVV